MASSNPSPAEYFAPIASTTGVATTLVITATHTTVFSTLPSPPEDASNDDHRALVSFIITTLRCAASDSPLPLTYSKYQLVTATPTTITLVGPSRSSMLIFHAVKHQLFVVVTSEWPAIPNVVMEGVEGTLRGMELL